MSKTTDEKFLENQDEFDQLWTDLETKICDVFSAVCQFPSDKQLSATKKVERALLIFIRDMRKSNRTLPAQSHEENQNSVKTSEGEILGFSDFNLLDKKPSGKKRGRPKENLVHMCAICEKVFKRPCLLKEHVMSVHEGVRPNNPVTQCEDCGRLFHTRVGLNAHRKRYHDVGRQVFRCSKCTFATYLQEKFNSHMEEMHGPYAKFKSVCEVCGKGFAQEKQLKMHRETHNTERKYKCKQCDFSTNTLSGLRSHNYTQHNPNAKTYQCKECNKQWKRRVLYKFHMEKHHNIKIASDVKPGPSGVCISTVKPEPVPVKPEPVTAKPELTAVEPAPITETLITITSGPPPIGVMEELTPNLPCFTQPNFPALEADKDPSASIPTMCVQVNPNELNSLDFISPFNAAKFNMDSVSTTLQNADGHNIPVSNHNASINSLPDLPAMNLQQNIPITVIDDLLKHMDYEVNDYKQPL